MGTNPKKSEPISKKCGLLWFPLGLIAIYQYAISPLIGPRCRFYPTCSCYAQEAYQKFGLLKGTLLSIKRLLKCHPWNEGGIDLVPDDKPLTTEKKM